LEIDWNDAEEDILDDVWGAGIDSGFGVAILVGARSNDTVVGVLLVVSVSK
jgi:hypothetical protein